MKMGINIRQNAVAQRHRVSRKRGSSVRISELRVFEFNIENFFYFAMRHLRGGAMVECGPSWLVELPMLFPRTPRPNSDTLPRPKHQRNRLRPYRR